MKLPVLLAGCLLLLWWPGTAQHNQATPGLVQVKFKKEYQQQLDTRPIASSRARTGKTGIKPLDALLVQRPVYTMERIFRASPRFEKAHRAYELHLWYQVRFDPSTSLSEVLREFKATNVFDAVEPRYSYTTGTTPMKSEAARVQVESNDPLFSNQWHYHNEGQTGGAPGVDISLKSAWDIQQGSAEVIVAIIDGGIDIAHPDLAAAMWVNTAEVAGNGIDDDNNGYVDDVHGYNFADDTGTIFPHFHGTHVAGTVGAITNNNVGVAGVAGGSGTADGVRLMSCVGFGLIGTGGFEEAMVYAADHGAVISQNSWMGGSTAIEDAIDYFARRAGYNNTDTLFDQNIQTGPMAGGLVVFAAGNDSDDTGYPASYSPVLSVASTDNNDVKSDFSNFGSWVDISAPGSLVFSTYPIDSGSYTHLSGTSMACPHVSGVAALVISEFGGAGFHPGQVADRLTATATPIDALNSGLENMLGTGRLNAYAALTATDAIAPAAILDLAVDSLESNFVQLTWTATGMDGTTGRASNYEIRYSTTPLDAVTFAQAQLLVAPMRPATAGEAEYYSVGGLAAATTYYLALRATDFTGNVSDLSNILTVVTPQPAEVDASVLHVEVDVTTGETATRSLTISNTGASTLVWTIQEQGVVETAPTVAPGTFQLKAPSPEPLTCVAIDPTTGIVYGQVNYHYNFYAYDPGTNTWSSLTPSPLYAGNNGGAVYLDGKIYTSYTFQNDIGVYDIASNAWSTLSATFPTGNIATDGEHLYLLRDGTLRRYHVATQSWADMPGPPISYSPWGAMSYSNRYLYAHPGDGSTLFMRYSIDEVQWTTLPQPPGRMVMGGTFDELSGKFYAYGPYGGAQLYSYNADDAQWDARSFPFFVLNDGGIVSSPRDKGVYFVEGELGTGFAFYKVIPTMPWAKALSIAGMTAAGNDADVDLLFDPGQLTTGTYTGYLHIVSNDPQQDTLGVQLTLNVTGIPAIDISSDSLAFGQVYVGNAAGQQVLVRNVGTDTLTVSVAPPEHVNVSHANVTLLPGAEQLLTLTLNTTTPHLITGHVTLSSNDPEAPTVTVKVSGSVVEPPALVLSPEEVQLVLEPGEALDIPLELENTGGSALHYSLFAGRVDSTLAKDLTGKVIALMVSDTDQYTTLMDDLQGRGATISLVALPLTSLPDSISILIVDQQLQYFSQGDLDLLRAWIEDGGRFMLAAGNPATISKANPLLTGSGLWQFALVEVTSDTLDVLLPHEITRGISSISSETSIMAVDVSGAAIALVRDYQLRGHVALSSVGNGHVVVFANDLLTDVNVSHVGTRRLVNQAIDWLSGKHVWLSVDEQEGSLEMSTTHSVTLSATASHLKEGEYSTLLVINSNVPDKEVVMLPVHVLVRQNTAPYVLTEIPEQTLLLDASLEIALDTIFADATDAMLTYQVTIDEESIASAHLHETNLEVHPMQPGKAVITLTASDPKGLSVSTTLALSVIVVTLAETPLAPVELYPNPATQVLVMRVRANTSAVSLEIYDVHGRSVLSYEEETTADDELHVSIEDLSPGAYVYRIRTGGVVQAGKLMIQR